MTAADPRSHRQCRSELPSCCILGNSRAVGCCAARPVHLHGSNPQGHAVVKWEQNYMMVFRRHAILCENDAI